MARQSRWLVPFAIAGLVAAGAAAQTGVKRVSAPHVRGIDGVTLFQAYCAACHGTTAEGNGPAAGRLSEPIPDLTRIAERDGRYDLTHVCSHLRSAARRPETMPDVHAILIGNYGRDDGRVMLAERNIALYLGGLQKR
jgi:mono/diheme cytochrome c family protein